MTDYLDIARRRRDSIRSTDAPATPIAYREISEISEESQRDGGLISHNSLFSQPGAGSASATAPSRRPQMTIGATDAGTTPRCVEQFGEAADSDSGEGRPASTMWPESGCEISEESEKSQADMVGRGLAADPFRAWRLRNARLLAEAAGQAVEDHCGSCAVHHRALSYPEQKRGACSWCVAVDPVREPEYWASHWRRFTEGR